MDISIWKDFSIAMLMRDVVSVLPEKSWDVLERIIKTGHAEGEPTPGAGGEITYDEVKILFNLTRFINPARTLEIGFAKGTSALSILSALDPAIAGPHTVIDPMQTSAYRQNGMKNVRYAGFGERIRLIEAWSHVALPVLLLNEQAKFDYVFIDASHMFDWTMLEFFYCDKMIDVGGVIVFDDCEYASVGAVVNFVETNMPYKIIRITERIWAAIKVGVDQRRWSDFNVFNIPNGYYYDKMIGKC